MATNSFFDWSAATRFVRFDTVRSSDANAALDLVTVGFNKLPTPYELHGGTANYAAASGAVNAFAVTLDANVTSLVDGLEVRFKANLANTGVATLTVTGSGAFAAKTIVRPTGNALEAGDIALGMLVTCVYDATNDRFQLATLSSGGAAPTTVFSGTAGGTIDLLSGVPIASAATINLNTATGNRVHVTGTTPITAVTLARGPREVIFDGILTLTHHATNNNLPGAANITTAAGDRAIYSSDGTTVYCMAYTRASGLSVVAPPTPFTYDAHTANVQLTAANFASSTRIFRDITANSFTQTLVAAATIGVGWMRIRNSGVGDITIDPNGAELWDGLSSFIMYPGECRDVYCDGAAFRSVVVSPFAKTFTANGTYTNPPGYNYYGGLLWAGGGSGSRTSGSATGGGGGACVPFSLPAGNFGTTEVVTIGALAAGPTTNVAGTNGNNSTLGALVTAYGGAGGLLGNSGGGGGGPLSAGSTSAGGSPAGGAVGATSPGGDSSFGGGGGGNGNGGAGGKSFYGGGGGGSSGGGGSTNGGQSAYGGGGGGGGGQTTTGGQSLWGGAGGGGSAASSGTDGTAPGGGGGGTGTGIKAGDGARGELRIWGIV
jgi:hypothetical protein